VLKTKRSGNIACGVFLALLGLAAAWASTSIDEGAGGQLHPRTFPVLIGVLLFLGGGLLAFAGWMDRRTGKTIDWPDRRGWRLWSLAFVYVVFIRLLELTLPMGPLEFLS
jgi:peptidoglycan/LPS O-acetylase OafA/YrhL